MSSSERAPISKFQATASGELLIGPAALDYHLEAGGHPVDIQPLTTAMTDPKWEKATGINKRGWTLDNAVAHTHFLARVHAVKPPKKLRMPSENQFTEAANYGLSPAPSRLRVISGGSRNLYKLTGLKARSENQHGVFKFRNMTFGECVKIARRIVREYGTFDSSTIAIAHSKGYSPTRATYYRYGTLAHMREYLGLDIDVENWTTDDYKDWGVIVMTANNGWLPNLKAIAAHIKPEYRPGANTIRSHFGELKFRKLVEDEYDAKQRQKSKQHKQQLEEYGKLELPPVWSEQLSDERRTEIVRIVRLFRRLGVNGNLNLEQISTTGADLRLILGGKSRKSLAEIELAALELDAFELLYPDLKPDLRKYRVPVPNRKVKRTIVE